MTEKHHSFKAAIPTPGRGRQAGVTLTEVVGGIFLVALVITVGYKMYVNQKEKEELLDCMTEMRGVHASVLEMSARGSFAGSGELWEMNSRGGSGDGVFCYVTDGSAADDGERGSRKGSKDDVSFVLFCQHDHGSLARYVYLTEEGRPTVATKDHDPDYQRFVMRENGSSDGSVGASD